jgi:hypothetical protein
MWTVGIRGTDTILKLNDILKCPHCKYGIIEEMTYRLNVGIIK